MRGLAALFVVLSLSAAPVGVAARVFADDPSQDGRRALAASETLARSVVLLTPAEGRRADGRIDFVTGTFIGDCRTVLTVRHFRRMAGSARPRLLFRDRRGVWIRRRGPRLDGVAGGVGGVAGDWMILRLERPIPDCLALTLSLGVGPRRCARLGLVSLQAIGRGGRAVPTLSTGCAGWPRAEAGLIGHSCDLARGASGGALLCLQGDAPVAIGLQVGRIRTRSIGDTAPNRAARAAPNIAIGLGAIRDALGGR